MAFRIGGRLAALLALVFGLALAVVSWPRYTPPPEVARWLLGPACVSIMEGCILGIQPGVTPFEEAFATLEQHPWVETVVTFDEGHDGGTVSWRWNDSAPAFISSTSRGSFFYGDEGRVRWITVPLRLRLGDLRLLLGRPEWQTYAIQHTRMNSNYPRVIYFYDHYAGGTIRLRYGAACPPRGRVALLEAAAWVGVRTPGASFYDEAGEPVPVGRVWADECTF